MKNPTKKQPSINSVSTHFNNCLEVARNIYEESSKQNHDINGKRLNIVSESDNQFYAISKAALSGINEDLQNPNLSEDERKKLYSNRMGIVERMDKKNTEIGLRESENTRRDAIDRQQRFCNIATLSIYIFLAGACAFAGGRCPKILRHVDFPNLLDRST